MSAAERKPFLLRVDPEILGEIQRWADDELRSLNGQIEFLLRQALRQAKRTPKQRPPDAGGSTASDSRDMSQ